MRYNIYIGKNFINVYNPTNDEYVSFDGNDYILTPYGIFDEINGKPNLDKLTRFFQNTFANYLDADPDISFGIHYSSEFNEKVFKNAFQKAGFYKSIKDARNHLSFFVIKEKVNDDDTYNGDIAKTFWFEEKIDLSKKTIHSYGIYDAESNEIYEVVPRNTPFDELCFEKKACQNYKYYVDVMQVNNYYNQVVLTICEDKEERLYISYEGKRLSGQYRLYFYVLENYMCIDIYDIVRNEWISVDDSIVSRKFEMR